MLKSGERLSVHQANPKGHPLNPMSAAQRRAKQRAALTLVMADVAADRLTGDLDALQDTPVHVLGDLIRTGLGVE